MPAPPPDPSSTRLAASLGRAINFPVADAVRVECWRHDVQVDAEVSAGLLSPRRIGIEAPAKIHRGIYDVDLIGAFTYLGGRDSMFYHVGTIGRFCAIATNVLMGDAEHPTNFLSVHPVFQADPLWRTSARDFLARNQAMIEKCTASRRALNEQRFGKIEIGNDVWIGEGVFIRRGVEIGDGAIVGARSVVTHDVPPYAIVAGAPARIIRYRFDPDVIEELLRLQWWLYGLSALDGVDFTDIDTALSRIDENITSGRATLYEAPILNVGQNDVEILRFDPMTGSLNS